MAYIPLRPSKAPNLLIAPVEYAQQYQDQLNNALRLYFNQVDNFSFALNDTNGGAYLSFPHIAASDSTDQYADGNDTPTVVAWDTLDSGSGWTLNAPGSATADVSGIYKITYSAELANTDNAEHDAVFWLKVDSGSGFVDVPNSATVFGLPARKNSGDPSFVTAYSEVTFQVNAGDVVELWWATDQAYDTSPATDGVYIYHEPAWTVAGGDPYDRPAVPSVIGSITFVCRLPTTA